jgi:hypothetical protein
MCIVEKGVFWGAFSKCAFSFYMADRIVNALVMCRGFYVTALFPGLVRLQVRPEEEFRSQLEEI